MSGDREDRENKHLEHVRRRGRQLSVMSALVLVFIASGARVTREGVAGFAFIEFAHPGVLYLAGYLLFVHALWQFYIADPEAEWRIFRAWQRLTREDPKWKAAVERVVQSCRCQVDDWRENAGADSKSLSAQDRGGIDTLLFAADRTLAPVQLRSRLSPTVPVRGHSKRHGDKGYADAPLPRRTYCRLWPRRVRRVVMDDEAAMYLVPIALAFLALATMWYALVAWIFNSGPLPHAFRAIGG